MKIPTNFLQLNIPVCTFREDVALALASSGYFVSMQGEALLIGLTEDDQFIHAEDSE